MEDSDRSFKVGEWVMKRDGLREEEEWTPGYVTQVDPLKVTESLDPQERGYARLISWTEVRKMDEEERNQLRDCSRQSRSCT
jgi:hypothetical protein